jgi:phosphoribosylglycinamide formyltransferase 1
VSLPSLAVLASGAGTNLQAVLDAIGDGRLDARVAAVISDKPGSGALRRAEAAGVPAVLLPLADRKDPDSRAAYDARLADVVATFDPDLIVLAGWMLILGPAFLDRFAGRIVNVHPALLPDGDGDTVPTSHGEIPALRGPRTVREALARKLPLTGATVHFVTETVDAGPVILREEVLILPGDDEQCLHERIKAVEHRLLPEAIARALADQRRVDGMPK